MKRKKWTPQEEVTEALLKVRERKKWQLALRRYIMEQMAGPQYAPYFGLTIKDFRKWIELQFTNELTWDNFGVEWQFDHIIPIALFDFTVEEEMKLCWNFINVGIEKLNKAEAKDKKVDVLSAKNYFENLYNKTGYKQCLRMLEKIQVLENGYNNMKPALESFILERKDYLETIDTLTHDEFNSLNAGVAIKDILLEKEMLKKFG